MKTTRHDLITAAQILVGIAVGIVGCTGIFIYSFSATIMNNSSPDRLHSAKLVRIQGIDINLRVTVDGSLVYVSPDFAPTHADFGERIVWAADSHAVVLEVAGRRLFGYDIVKGRALTDPELFAVQFLSFDELQFEGQLPREATLE